VKYLADSDVVVDWLNGHQPTITALTPLIPTASG
jgi:hypothetical protein